MSSLLWKHPFTSIIAGPTSSGKSTFVRKFIQHIEKIVDQPIYEIVYCSPILHAYNEKCNVKITYYDSIPDVLNVFSDKKNRLLILDDMMREAGDDVVDLYTKYSHHLNLSIMFISQNFFSSGKGRRDLSLNTHYIVYFKNPRDKQQIVYLAKQICPENRKFVQEAFIDATSKPYGYILFDLTQTTPEHLRFRTNIFSEDYGGNNRGPIIYIPKNVCI